MTKRPYIACPLEAALAVKNFNLKAALSNQSFNIQFEDKSGARLDHQVVKNQMTWWYRINNEPYLGSEFYLREGSLPLLEPMVGDLVEVNRGQILYGIITDLEKNTGFYINGTHWGSYDFKIIQRNGKQFPKIEWEETT